MVRHRLHTYSIFAYFSSLKWRVVALFLKAMVSVYLCGLGETGATSYILVLVMRREESNSATAAHVFVPSLMSKSVSLYHNNT